MANEFDNNKRSVALASIDARMEGANNGLKIVNQNIRDVNQHWNDYKAGNPSSQDLADTGEVFSGKCSALFSGNKADFAASLDIIAGGMSVTRQELLDQLAAVGE